MSRRLGWIGAALVLIAVVLWLFNRPQAAYGMTSYDGDGVRVQVADATEEAQAMERTAFVVTLADGDGKPLSGAALRIVLSMPHMFCGEYEATVTETAPGVYRAEGVPTMRGRWQAKLTLEDNGRKIAVVHDFKVV